VHARLAVSAAVRGTLGATVGTAVSTTVVHARLALGAAVRGTFCFCLAHGSPCVRRMDR